MADNVTKEIRYLNKDFSSFRKNLINYAKIYFSNIFNDYSDTDPSIMFIEMAAYVGDVLSYYMDNQFKESLLAYAEEKRNVYAISQALGYKPRIIVPAATTLDVYQIVPATGTNGETPDYNYTLRIDKNMQVASATNRSIIFKTRDPINFGFSNNASPLEISIYRTDGAGKPTHYLLKKQALAEAGILKNTAITVTDPQKYFKFTIPESNIISIDRIYDADGNDWYEVPYLAQDTIFYDVLNEISNDPTLAQYNDSVPYILKQKKVPRRFVTRYTSEGAVEVQFGAGISANPDEEILPTPDNIGLMTPTNVEKLNYNWDLSNFLYSTAYGQVPHNTTLTVEYTVGGGISSNVLANNLTILYDVTAVVKAGSDASTSDYVKNSLAVNNPDPATGGRDGETADEIRLNAMASFQSQGRAVTKEDYILRALSMPPKFGSISKVYIVQDDQLNFIDYRNRLRNPLSMNMYVLSFNADKQLTVANQAIKTNLRTYIDKYRMMTDAINIKDAYIVNIGVKFEIMILNNYASQEVLVECIKVLKDYFNIDRWQINQPIYINDIYSKLLAVRGVQNILSIKIENLFDETLGYQTNVYDINVATINNIIYPSMDPCIFECRFPDNDISGRCITY